MKIVVIGASGHIGTFLVPRLVRAGHEVVNISRGERTAYADAPEWQHVRQVVADRVQEDRDGSFGDRIAGLRAEAVVDLVCFTLESATALVDRLRGELAHLLHCGPLGNLDPAVWQALAAGRRLRIPGVGAELMHHVHADDVAQAFERAVERRAAAAGEDFNVVAPTALNVRGFAEIAAGWFGQEATLETVSWEEFRRSTTAEFAQSSWEHLVRSHCFSIEKAARLLGYAPRYDPDAAVLESVRWLIDHDQLQVA